MLPRAFWLSLLGGICAANSLAQAPLRGVVWDSDIPPAVEDFVLIRQTGIEAVRLPLLTDKQLLFDADSLGLALFQELSMRYLPATGLLDSLASASARLTAALQMGSDHPSARHYGLAYFSDTSSDAACPYFNELARLAEEYTDAAVYYVSPFIQGDRCGDAVDFVLLDFRHHEDPMAAMAQWTGSSPIGIGALGRYAVGEAVGLRHDRSAQSQARYLETHLTTLMETPLHSVFVHRWQDADLSSEAHRWGLVDAYDRPQPALSVVHGIYSGRQTVFAFSAGVPAKAGTPWLLIVGWLIVLTLGVNYTLSPPWRNLVHRYLTRHGFYLDSVKMGREFPGAACSTFLLLQALIVGCVAWILIKAAMATLANEAIHASLGPVMQAQADAMLAEPWRIVLAFGGFYLAYQVVLMLTSMAILEWRNPADVRRAFIVQISAQWHSILLLPLLMMAPSIAQESPRILAGLTAGCLLLATLASSIRLVSDYAAIVSPNRRLACFLMLWPMVLLLTGLLVLAVYSPLGDYAGFWWQLIVYR